MTLTARFSVLRTSDLRELLEDEDKINHLVRCSGKIQELQRSAERILLLNHKLAHSTLWQKSKFRDTKLLLAYKYKELVKLKDMIKVKQEQLGLKKNFVKDCLIKKINRSDVKCELLFQKFEDAKMPLARFLESFIRLRKCYHTRSVLVRKLQEVIEAEWRVHQTSHPDYQDSLVSFHKQLLYTNVVPALAFPACCPLVCPVYHSLFKLPLSVQANATPSLQHLSVLFDGMSLYGLRKSDKTSPTRPVRLQPLKKGHRRLARVPYDSEQVNHGETFLALVEIIRKMELVKKALVTL